MKNINIEVRKNQNENNTSLLRRFSKRMQESGIIQKVKKIRYNEKPESKLSMKNRALKKIIRVKEMDKMKKLGKIS